MDPGGSGVDPRGSGWIQEVRVDPGIRGRSRGVRMDPGGIDNMYTSCVDLFSFILKYLKIHCTLVKPLEYLQIQIHKLEHQRC